MDLADRLRALFERNHLDRDRNDPLVERANLTELPVAPLGANRVGAHKPDHGVGGTDEVGEFLLPFLAVRKIPTIDGDGKALPLERGDQPFGNLEVPPGVGQEYADMLRCWCWPRRLRRPVVPHRPISPRATLISTRISAGTPFSERLLRICAKQSSPAREQGPAVQGVGRRPLTRKLARMAPESAQAAIRDGRDGLGGLGWWWELRS